MKITILFILKILKNKKKSTKINFYLKLYIIEIEPILGF